MQNPIKRFRQSSIVFEKPGILPEKLKILTNVNYNLGQMIVAKFTKLSKIGFSISFYRKTSKFGFRVTGV